jgi:hypothetical protein
LTTTSVAAIFLSSKMLLKLTTVAVGFLVWAPVASAWSWPVTGPVLQPFSYDEGHPYDAGQHRGVDIGASVSGDPVLAPETGTVSFAGFVPTSGESVTIETADGYAVTLTHLGSIGVAAGATVAEGDVVGTVGPSGSPEQAVPYVHLGIRLTADELGYVDPLGFLPPVESAPPPAPTPTPAPQPVRQAAPAPTHVHGGGLVIEKPAPAAPVVITPARPAHTAKPKLETRPMPARHTFRAVVRHIRQPVPEPVSSGVPVVAPRFVHPMEVQPLVLSIGPGVLAALLALATAFARIRRPAPVPAKVIAFRRELPLRRAA